MSSHSISRSSPTLRTPLDLATPGAAGLFAQAGAAIARIWRSRRATGARSWALADREFASIVGSAASSMPNLATELRVASKRA
jgi:hypothetical protein